MSADLYLTARFGFGLLIIGGSYLWVEQLRCRNRLPQTFENLLRHRLHYGLVGIVAGYTVLPALQDLFSESALLATAFFGGWCGLVVGLGLDARVLQRIPGLPLLFEAGQTGAVILGVFVLVFLTARSLAAGAHLQGGVLLMLCGLCAAGVADNRLSGSQRGKIASRRGSFSLPASAGIVLAGLGSMYLRGVAFEMRQPFAPVTGIIVVDTLAAQILWTLLLGAATGLIVDLLIRGAERVEVFYLIASGLALGSGVAAVLGLEPLWVGLVGGAWLINGTLQRRDVLRTVERSRGTVNIGLRFTAGWLLGHGLAADGVDAALFVWMLALVALVRPVFHYAGRKIMRRLLTARYSGRVREKGVFKLPALDDLTLVVAVALLELVGGAGGVAVLAGVLVGQWGLALAGDRSDLRPAPDRTGQRSSAPASS